MLWPFVRRAELDDVRRQLRASKALARESQARATATDTLNDVLRSQLERSENERTDATYKLIRVGFGINPFAESMQQTSAAPQEDAEPAHPPISPGASPEEVRATFVREAVDRYGNDLRKISRYVEQRQTEFYAHRDAPQILTPSEIEQAARVAADLHAALEEGAAAARKE